MTGPRRRWPDGPVVAAAAALGVGAWAVAGLRPFTWPALLAVEGAGVTVMLLAARRRPGPPPRRDLERRGTGTWIALAVALAAWELAAFVQHPRAEHPTLSSLAGQVLAERPARAAAFLAWLAGAAALARR